MSERLQELRDKALKISQEGLAEAINKNYKRCIELQKELEPVLLEMSEITGNENFRELVDEGRRISAKHNQ